MSKWSEVSWKRVGRVLLIIFATPILFLGMRLIVDRQLAPWRYARFLSDSDPYMDLLPETPPDSRVAALEGERVERFGFSFQLPWKHVARQATYPTFAFLSSNDGQTITVGNPLSSGDLFSSVHLVAKHNPWGGKEALGSGCAWIAQAMAARTEQVKWWRSPGQNARSSYLLMVKSMIELRSRGRPYIVRHGEVCGIQQGSPSSAPSEVKLNLFDSADLHYEITIDHHNSARPLTQAEVNAVIASLRPIEHN